MAALSTAQKRANIRSREEREQPFDIMLQQLVTFLSGHLVAGIIAPEAAFQCIAVVIEISTTSSTDISPVNISGGCPTSSEISS